MRSSATIRRHGRLEDGGVRKRRLRKPAFQPKQSGFGMRPVKSYAGRLDDVVICISNQKACGPALAPQSKKGRNSRRCNDNLTWYGDVGAKWRTRIGWSHGEFAEFQVDRR